MFGKQKFQTVSSPIADRFTKACGQPILNGASAQTMLPPDFVNAYPKIHQ